MKGCKECRWTGWVVDPETDTASRCACIVEQLADQTAEETSTLPSKNPEQTLQDARRRLLKRLDEGTICPCCGQTAKRYRRKLTSQMARVLVELHFATRKEGLVHKRDLESHDGSGDLGKLAHWGLVHSPEGTNAGGSNRSGYWQTTEKGDRFVRDEIKVPRYVHLYNGRRLGFSKEMTDIRTAIGDHFDYEELMRWQSSTPDEEFRAPYPND
jgi:hypothetical protein